MGGQIRQRLWEAKDYMGLQESKQYIGGQIEQRLQVFKEKRVGLQDYNRLQELKDNGGAMYRGPHTTYDSEEKIGGQI